MKKVDATITHKCHNFLYIIISMFQVILMWGESDIQFINGALIWMVPSDLKHLWLLITLWGSSTCLVLFSKYCHGQFTARKISCQSLVFRGDSSFQPCDSYPPPSTGCQSRVCPSYLCLFFIQNIPESEKCLFRRKFLIGQEPYFLVKLKLWCISAHFDKKSRIKVFRVKSFTHSLTKLMSQN